MRKRQHRPFAAAGLLGLLAAAPAFAANAQDPPLIDAVGAYNHANVMTRPRHHDDGAPGRRTPANTPAQPAGTLSKQAYADLVSGLRAEYGRRLDRDGKASADAWLEAAVADLKQRYTRVAD